MEEKLYPALITEALRNVRYPGNGKDLVENNMVEDDIRIDGMNVSFSLIFDKSTDPFIKSVVKAAETAVKTYASENARIEGNISVKYRQNVEQPAKMLPGVKNIIGVSSGKGGVGKSTVASNLAVALAKQGYKVGLLDADIFGPSAPKMFGVEDAPVYMDEVGGRNLIAPVEQYGVKVLSIGFLVDKDNAVLWRGGMASNALKQLIGDANWGDLDYFVIDMPPGTSDIHLTLVQTLAITGAVVVTTPQEVALADARKGVSMFQSPQVNVPVLGIVENMAWFTPASHPDERYYIFGREGGVRLAEKEGVKVLAQIPLVMDIRERADDGRPVAADLEQGAADGDKAPNPEAEAFAELAGNVVKAVDLRNSQLPPSSKVEMTH